MTMIDARYTPPAEREANQLFERSIHDCLAIRLHTDALHELGSFYFEKAGFAGIDRLSVHVICKERDYRSIQAMVIHAAAVSHLGGMGWSSDHLAFYPSVSRGRTRMFTDQHGARRRGAVHTVSFELSPKLAAVIDWTYRSRGKLTVRENGLPV